MFVITCITDSVGDILTTMNGQPRNHGSITGRGNISLFVIASRPSPAPIHLVCNRPGGSSPGLVPNVCLSEANEERH